VQGKGGDILVLDVGEPAKITDLAWRLIRRSGLQIELDIKIELSGRRAGERSYSSLGIDRPSNRLPTRTLEFEGSFNRHMPAKRS
jgi:FlaA1/EpsC-like NDP-sugar epimerase